MFIPPYVQVYITESLCSHAPSSPPMKLPYAPAASNLWPLLGFIALFCSLHLLSVLCCYAYIFCATRLFLALRAGGRCMFGLSSSLGIPNTVPRTSVIKRASGTNSR